MAITSSESPHDMSRWVAEKADCVLEEACKIGDILRKNNVTLSEFDEAEFSQALRSIIFDAAKLSSFGHENMKSWSNEWVDLMLDQGRDRFFEFQKRVGLSSASAIEKMVQFGPPGLGFFFPQQTIGCRLVGLNRLALFGQTLFDHLCYPQRLLRPLQ